MVGNPCCWSKQEKSFLCAVYAPEVSCTLQYLDQTYACNRTVQESAVWVWQVYNCIFTKLHHILQGSKKFGVHYQDVSHAVCGRESGARIPLAPQQQTVTIIDSHSIVTI